MEEQKSWHVCACMRCCFHSLVSPAGVFWFTSPFRCVIVTVFRSQWFRLELCCITPPPLFHCDSCLLVIPLMEVYNKSLCQPRELLVEILQEYPEEVEHIFIPSCVVLTRCAGCCNDEIMQCTPTSSYNITMEVSSVVCKSSSLGVLCSGSDEGLPSRPLLLKLPNLSKTCLNLCPLMDSWRRYIMLFFISLSVLYMFLCM